jgi:hemin uptake protein HemP
VSEPAEPGEAAAPRPADGRPAIVRTEDLFGARREVIIKHGQEEYRLRITRADKLILTK